MSNGGRVNSQDLISGEMVTGIHGAGHLAVNAAMLLAVPSDSCRSGLSMGSLLVHLLVGPLTTHRSSAFSNFFRVPTRSIFERTQLLTQWG